MPCFADICWWLLLTYCWSLSDIQLLICFLVVLIISACAKNFWSLLWFVLWLLIIIDKCWGKYCWYWAAQINAVDIEPLAGRVQMDWGLTKLNNGRFKKTVSFNNSISWYSYWGFFPADWDNYNDTKHKTHEKTSFSTVSSKSISTISCLKYWHSIF